MKLKVVGIKLRRGQLIDVRAQGLAVDNALDMASAAIKVDFNVTTRTWEKRPEFVIEKEKYGRHIFTTNEIYGYVERGTPPHRIEPRNASALRFQSGYKRKSVVGVIASRQGGPYGPVVYSQGVDHPGYEGTGDAATIQKKWNREWPRTLQRAITAAI